MMTTADAAIRVRGLRKAYVVHEREAGLAASLRSLVKRRAKEVLAVDGITFDVAPGERMKCEIAVALLHRPQVLFLDEPTIGLDVTMQRRIRGFIAEYNRRHGATVLLTSHYMADVVALCKRVVVIHHGQLLFDGDLAALADRFAAYKTIEVALADGFVSLDQYGEVLERDGDRVKFRVPKAETPRIAARVLSEQQVADLTIEDPPIEDVIELVFAQERPE